MKLRKKIHLMLPLAIGLLVGAGGESPASEPSIAVADAAGLRVGILIARPKPGIDYKIRIATVPDDLDTGILSPSGR
jgi:hypothetical protein